MNALRLASLVSLLAPSLALAQPQVDPVPAPGPAPSAMAPMPQLSAQAAPAPDPSVAITLSPVHLAIPMVEVTLEARLAPKIGVAVVVGAGATRVDTIADPIRLLEVGGSVRYYVLGSFRTGLQLGAEGVYVHANVDDPSVDIRARGLALSPFGGYKWTHSSGFTLEGQLGVSFYTLRAESMTTSAEESDIGPMLNLNAGYSF